MNFFYRLRFDRIMAMSLWYLFWPTLCVLSYDRCMHSSKGTVLNDLQFSRLYTQFAIVL